MKFPLMLLVFFACAAEAIMAKEPYTEKYRPQYHFTPREGWIGDPDGCIRFRGQYHLLWWGHAVSTDLVYWTELPWPMKGDDGSFMYFTGSVVVDGKNTGGWNKPDNPAMVAIYTAHDRATGLQNQRLSISHDYKTFQYYEGNPVLDINSRSFRDPDVFWHEESRRWIMAITLPDDRKINFYASPDLKAWTFLSSFGPLAAQDGLWEVPILFQLPLDGDASNKKWVLVCSMGPSLAQFFVGHFDGTRFTLDERDEAYLMHGAGLPGEVWEDFEGRTLRRWSVRGEAFSGAPFARRKEFPITGLLGRGLASSGVRSDEALGTMRSAPFTIRRNAINFLIAGGRQPGDACINLLVNGEIVRSTTGQESDRLKWAGWVVADLIGEEAVIEIVDRSPTRWGHINVDHIMFSDVVINTGREHANWIDWGPDFYAMRIFRDYDGVMDSTVWMAWMGSWDYANDTPTTWGRGVQSIPREISLVSTPRGYEIHQRPWPALRQLRGPEIEVSSMLVRDAVPVEAFKPARNVYEVEAVFYLDDAGAQQVGLNLCAGGGDVVAIGYDALSRNVFLDRRKSGNVGFSERFPRRVSAPFFEPGGEIKFNVFVDQSSIEVFVNDGRRVLTSQIYPDPGNRGVELFSYRGDVILSSLSAWELASIWEKPPTGKEEP